MKKLITLLTGILIFASLSQSQNLGIDSTKQNLTNLPDTIFINDNFSHTIHITNFSSTPLTGNIYLMGAVDSAGTYISTDTLGIKPVNAFGLADTISFNYSEIYNFANSYKLGGNIVVVWPVADFGTTKDTLSKPVYIKASTNINKFIEKSINVYPNPFIDNIRIESNIKNTIIHVKVFDINGKLILSRSYSQEIDLSGEPKGIYFLELLFDDKTVQHYKMIKK